MESQTWVPSGDGRSVIGLSRETVPCWTVGLDQTVDAEVTRDDLLHPNQGHPHHRADLAVAGLLCVGAPAPPTKVLRRPPGALHHVQFNVRA